MLARFCETINTQGGHILVLLFLSVLGCVALKLGIPKAEDVFYGSFTALLAVLAPKALTAVVSKADAA